MAVLLPLERGTRPARVIIQDTDGPLAHPGDEQTSEQQDADATDH
jgi:hypothetical protein